MIIKTEKVVLYLKKDMPPLPTDDIYKSFNAMKAFLQDGKNMSQGGLVPCKVSHAYQSPQEWELDVDLVDVVPSYRINNEVLKSYKVRIPLWTSEQILEWNEIEKILLIKTPLVILKLQRIV